MTVTPEETDKRYQFARQVAQDAADFAFSYYQQRQQLVVERKAGNMQDLVSRADREVEDLIRTRLKREYPEDGFLGEEGGASASDSHFVWVVDPIDGTSCFLNGLHTWCIAVAVLAGGEPVIGVICDPNHRELFHASKGHGAWLNETPMQVHKGRSVQEGITGISNSPKIAPERITHFINGLMQQGGMFMRSGSGALTTAYVAAGRLTGFYEPHMSAWDGLAGVVLVREAGGVSNDFLANNCLQHGNALLLANNEAVWLQLKAFTDGPLQA